MAESTWRIAPGAGRPRRGSLRLILFFTVLLAGALSAIPTEAQQIEAKQGLETLSIVTGGGTHEFSVEVMRTDAQRQRGLMFRKFLPGDRGMLFIFDSERPVAMWMKNTYLPLDMVFVAKTGRVVGLAEKTAPLSETIIPSGAPAYGVIELNAGVAAKIGLKIGDRVRYPAFSD